MKARDFLLPDADAIASALGVGVVLKASCEITGEFCQKERALLAALREERRHDWALSRTALKAVLEAMGENSDTSGLEPVRGRFSLSHSGHLAVAAGVASGRIGVDLETRAALPPESARFFLRANEHVACADRLPRLWAIKEAAFKADACNDGRILRDYQLAKPEAELGTVFIDNNVIQYACWHIGAGYLALAYSGERP